MTSPESPKRNLPPRPRPPRAAPPPTATLPKPSLKAFTSRPARGPNGRPAWTSGAPFAGQPTPDPVWDALLEVSSKLVEMFPEELSDPDNEPVPPAPETPEPPEAPAE